MSEDNQPKEETAEQTALGIYRDALRRIKLICLTQDSLIGIAGILRICLDAGISQKLDELRALEDKRMGREG